MASLAMPAEQIAAERPSSLLIPTEIARNLVDPSAHGDRRIHEACAWLRAHCPLGIAEPEGYDPFWVVTRQADLRQIAPRADLFHNGDRSIVLVDRAQSDRMRELLGGRPFPGRHVLQMDPPDHAKYRAVSAEFFHPRNLDQLEANIRGIARQFIDHMLSFDGACDFARDVAFLYPLRVVMSIIGVPPEDEVLMLRLTQELFGNSDPDQAREGKPTAGADAGDRFHEIVEDFFAYFDDLLADRRAHPRNDLASVIAQSTIDGGPMPRLEAVSYCFVAATAGHDTTAAVTAGGLQALCEHPAEFEKVKADRSLINAMVEEATRWVSPSKITMRSAAADFQICDRQFRKGDWVAMAWVSGNRDEQVFEDPFAFRVDRKPNKLIAYGNGPHVCLGQHLARLEMRLLFDELFRSIDHVELAGETKNLASLMVSGPKTVPIRFTAA